MPHSLGLIYTDTSADAPEIRMIPKHCFFVSLFTNEHDDTCGIYKCTAKKVRTDDPSNWDGT